ncbi:MAG TPA: hypothetical protein VHR15_20635, partial [Ktedonobacterales bacterium]|nr:hypothetical protein [Ktedonobacterales bacterium]
MEERARDRVPLRRTRTFASPYETNASGAPGRRKDVLYVIAAIALALLHAEPPRDFPYGPFLEALDKTSHRRMDGFRHFMPSDTDSMYIIWR